MKIIKLAQVGCGYWGPNLLRNFRSLNECSLEHIIEPNIDRQRFIKKSFPDVNVESDVSCVLNKKTIDAIIIATPAGEHFKLAKKALCANKHVFVEKPMARCVEEVEELTEIANSRNLTLMSGHTFLFNDAVRFIKSQIDSGETGDLRYIYSQRLNLGRIRSDVDALWNFAPHDVSIIQYLLNDPKPIEINSHGMDFIQPGINDVSFLNIKYDSCIANIHVSWLDPLKTRKL